MITADNKHTRTEAENVSQRVEIEQIIFQNKL